MKFRNNNFNLSGEIVDFNVKDPITLEVMQFYEKYPFPNYKINDNKQTILEEGNKNSFSEYSGKSCLSFDLIKYEIFFGKLFA